MAIKSAKASIDLTRVFRPSPIQPRLKVTKVFWQRPSFVVHNSIGYMVAGPCKCRQATEEQHEFARSQRTYLHGRNPRALLAENKIQLPPSVLNLDSSSST
jgi:hypothetical protein